MRVAKMGSMDHNAGGFVDMRSLQTGSVGGSMKAGDQHAIWEEVTRLIVENRDRCLWFLAPDFQPTNRDSAVRALRYIERYGGKVAFERARELRRWLQQPSSSNSAG
jgi:hypothetical protein